MEAAVLENWAMPNVRKVVKDTKEAGKRYHDQVQGKGADHPFGPPRLHK